MKIAITAILVLFFHVSQAGNIVTFQDYLIVNGDTLVLSNRPLDPYFELYPDLMPEMDEPYTHATEREGFEPNAPICSISVIYTNSFR